MNTPKSTLPTGVEIPVLKSIQAGTPQFDFVEDEARHLGTLNKKLLSLKTKRSRILANLHAIKEYLDGKPSPTGDTRKISRPELRGKIISLMQEEPERPLLSSAIKKKLMERGIFVSASSVRAVLNHTVKDGSSIQGRLLEGAGKGTVAGYSYLLTEKGLECDVFSIKDDWGSQSFYKRQVVPYLPVSPLYKAILHFIGHRIVTVFEIKDNLGEAKNGNNLNLALQALKNQRGLLAQPAPRRYVLTDLGKKTLTEIKKEERRKKKL